MKFIEDIEKVIDVHFPYRQLASVPIDRLLFHYLNIHGVYILYLHGNIIYIGQSINIGARLIAHIFQYGSYIKEVTNINIIRFKYNENFLEVETQLIDEFNPFYNKKNCYPGFEPLPKNFDINKIISQIKLGMDK